MWRWRRRSPALGQWWRGQAGQRRGARPGGGVAGGGRPTSGQLNNFLDIPGGGGGGRPGGARWPAPWPAALGGAAGQFLHENPSQLPSGGRPGTGETGLNRPATRPGGDLVGRVQVAVEYNGLMVEIDPAVVAKEFDPIVPAVVIGLAEEEIAQGAAVREFALIDPAAVTDLAVAAKEFVRTGLVAAIDPDDRATMSDPTDPVREVAESNGALAITAGPTIVRIVSPTVTSGTIGGTIIASTFRTIGTITGTTTGLALTTGGTTTGGVATVGHALTTTTSITGVRRHGPA